MSNMSRNCWLDIGSLIVLTMGVLCASCGGESSDANTMSGFGTGGVGGLVGGAGGVSASGGIGGNAGQAGVAAGGVGGMSATSFGGQGGGAAASGAGGMSSGGTGAQGGAAGVSGIGGMSGGASGTGGMGGMGGGGGGDSPVPGCEVAPITDAMRDQYANMNDDYYQKYADANGVIVATGTGVDDEAIVRYCRLLGEMTSNEKVRQAVIADDMWFTMIAEDEQLSSLPQIERMYGSAFDARARGLGGLTPTICAEDSIMCMPGDPWDGDCICPHEAGHTLYSSGIARVPELSSRLSDITDATRSSGRIANSYVWMDGNESGMMAWGVQVWYDCAINGSEGAYHPDINTRAELQQELPDFYEFLSELLPENNQYEDCYANP
jgi:hypothetical protein